MLAKRKLNLQQECVDSTLAWQKKLVRLVFTHRQRYRTFESLGSVQGDIRSSVGT